MAYNSNSNIKQASKVHYKKMSKGLSILSNVSRIYFRCFLHSLALFECFRIIHAIDH